MSKGYLAFVLHAHLPYVHHPEYDNFLEERWYFEAITETYIPLIKVFNGLSGEEIPFRLTLSISPSLLAMMEDELLQERFSVHLVKMIELAEKEEERTKHDPHFRYLAGMYRDLFSEARHIFDEECHRRLSVAFRALHEKGLIDLITTSATHALLPLFAGQPKTISAQITTGIDYFEDVFGFRPLGMWLPECGYFSGLEEFLEKEGIRFFILESHGLELARTTPLYGIHAPLYTPSGVAVFGRDRGSTKQVWSAREGFPGHPDYREFYRDIGYDLDFEYIHPYIAGDVRVDTGMKYFRITGATSLKEPYHPEAARERAARHAEEFLNHRSSHINYLDTVMETSPIVVAPFDAELFGHWWFEGPQWLDFVIRKTVFDQDTVELITLSEYLDRHPVHQMGIPCTSTWGHKGYFESWLNGRTDWIYPELRECYHRMESLSSRNGKGRVSSLKKRALSQCVRELFLAQSSDWPFIINSGTAAEYAARRVRDHVARFHYLAEALENEAINEPHLAALEYIDNIFPKADYKLFR